jgi:uncharacterized membrane protein
MVAGQQYQVSVRMRNSGGTTWGGNHRLGAQNPHDNMNWGMNRVALGANVAPGAEHTVAWTVTAPSTPGNYNFQWRMLQEFVEWFGGQTPNVVVNVQAPAGNASTFVSQSVPTTMTAGQQYQVSVRFRNSGGTTWTGNHKIGSWNPWDNRTWGMNRVSFPVSVAPGAEQTVTWTVTAPSTPGQYNFQWRTLQEFVEWFGATSTNVVVNVQAGNGATFVSQSVPTLMQPGQQYQVSVRFRNSGGKTWNGNHRLGSWNPWDNRVWGMNRVALGTSVAPGAEHSITWTVTAPSNPGQYNFQWRMLEEFVEWFGPASPNVAVTVQGAPGVNGAEFVSQDVPTLMQAGQQYQVSVRFRNSGTKTWIGNHRLGSQNPHDNMNWGPNRVLLEVDVAPGTEHTETWTVTAPSTPGQYNFQWRMLEEYVEWFGEPSQNLLVTVQ